MRTFIMLVFAGVMPAAACDCVLAPAKEALKASHLVFRGTIAEITDNEIVFVVRRVFKGNLPQRFAMARLVTDADCFPGFRRAFVTIGTELLVYASREPYFPEGPITNTCSRTAPIGKAAEDLKQLGSGRPPRQK